MAESNENEMESLPMAQSFVTDKICFLNHEIILKYLLGLNQWKTSQSHNPLLQVFFPVVSQSHYYLICFNLKQGSSHIFDNSVVDVPFSAKYGKISMIVSRNQIDDGRVRKLDKAKPQREQMNWRTTTNNVDCTIFMMRHMETYMGEKVKKWECGFAQECVTQKTQLDNLRHKYVARILLSDLNEKNELVLKKNEKFCKIPIEKQKQFLDNAKMMKNDRFNVEMTE
ncbi:hypothetical protein OSB04_027495 [Centaurea solstitialis]|uniref:Ubiquitin-like protease family profile domain-containing protein n=1 Tax=Centaurea solstitialis TaxID=347529 RepID=A0AA38SDP9_9ASTR|nr:hypothetical protein OSB04_027495 [Centaurea solstitialis]